MEIAVVDAGVGNLRSVVKALEFVGAVPRVVSDASAVDSASAVVLPGVGAFGANMDGLRAAGLEESLRRAATDGRPFLGICVGMQVLFESSEEFGPVTGLGVLPGNVRRLRPDSDHCKVPHMGWNEVHWKDRHWKDRHWKDEHCVGTKAAPTSSATRYYFVHSFHVVPERREDVAAVTSHGGEVVAAVRRGNLLATQFHPEKSQAAGLSLLRAFVHREDVAAS